jgi:DNA-binding transcriptional regulator YdaS (Cro superfamily)
MTPEEALAVAIKQIGGYAATARALGIKTAWAVQKWKRVPSARVQALIYALQDKGGAVTAHDLRPDIYPHSFVFPEPPADANPPIAADPAFEQFAARVRTADPSGAAPSRARQEEAELTLVTGRTKGLAALADQAAERRGAK